LSNGLTEIIGSAAAVGETRTPIRATNQPLPVVECFNLAFKADDTDIPCHVVWVKRNGSVWPLINGIDRRKAGPSRRDFYHESFSPLTWPCLFDPTVQGPTRAGRKIVVRRAAFAAHPKSVRTLAPLWPHGRQGNSDWNSPSALKSNFKSCKKARRTGIQRELLRSDFAGIFWLIYLIPFAVTAALVLFIETKTTNNPVLAILVLILLVWIAKFASRLNDCTILTRVVGFRSLRSSFPLPSF
jgi:hypothetical protein